METKTIFFTTVGAGTFTVPADFVSLIAIEAIGGGSSPGTYLSGGGGAYAKSTSASLSPGQVLYLNVGVGGSGGAGGDSWVNASSNAAPTLSSQGVLAAGGRFSNTGSNNGLAASSVGDVRFNGGSGGGSDAISGYSGGAGGAAGPQGIGKNGGNGYQQSGIDYGGGGGGAGGGLSTEGFTGNFVIAGVNTGKGGNGFNGTGAGNALVPPAASSQPGAQYSGAGGGGGRRGAGFTGSNGGSGGSGSGWVSYLNEIAGPGGGGGGGVIVSSGGLGGLYGGGGGHGGSYAIGAQGIIVFTYFTSTPVANSDLFAFF